MIFNVIGYSGEILGQIEADTPENAWYLAGKQYSNILDVRQSEVLQNYYPVSEDEATFPVEARADITFCKHMYDLEQTANRKLSKEEVCERWEKWKALRYRPKTDDERRMVHKVKYGDDELPQRGGGK